MGHVYATGDWHGNWAASQKLMEFLQPEDTLYFLGDATDRGRHGVALFRQLMNDPRVIMIKGNHDLFLEQAIEYINYDEAEMKGLACFVRSYAGFDPYGWITLNGGSATFDDLYKLSRKERDEIDITLKAMFTKAYYSSPEGHKVILEHAGYTPFKINLSENPYKHHDPLWDREHFEESWGEGFDDTYLVHGHTPVQYLKFYYGYNGEQPLTKEEMKYKKDFNDDLPSNYKPTILRYCDGHKFDIDMCTIYSNRVALLDLDTFEEHYFDGKDKD